MLIVGLKPMAHLKKLTLLLSMLFIFNGLAMAEDDKYAPVRDKLETCYACHGPNGASTQAAFPILAGQEFYYMYVQLKDMKKGLRDSAVMSPIAATLEKSEMKLMAEFFSKQEWPETSYKVSAEQQAAGKLVADAGQCVACHLGDLRGNSRVPRIANQHPDYLKTTMLDFKNGIRKNSPAVATLLKTYSEQELKDVAHYLSGFSE
jgi:cytochrome c553